ncbi:MAG: glycoside hydrolase family 15 protein [Acidobacteriaceae bacterium]|nr:glycoside hydrolase family 15 protein [Acidobacteriaceae bacterium]
MSQYADWLESHLDEWTTTKDGTLHADIKYHYMRVRPPAEGEPFHNAPFPPGRIYIANRGPGEQYEFDAREVVDGGFLELVRYGVRRPDDPLILNTLKVIDGVLKIETPYGPCWRRYNHDGYGQRKDGGPFIHFGQGRAWPILTGERAHYELAAGHDVTPYITAMERFSSFGGMMPEQIWDFADMPQEGLYFGRSAGSAQPLVWAHAEYIKLLRSVADGKVFDRISVVEKRYAVPREKRTFQSRMEIFQTGRPISDMVQGGTLRIIDQQRFRVIWTDDSWATKNTLESRVVGKPGSFADIQTSWDQTGSIEFTLFYIEENRWLGRNYEVTVHEGALPQSPVAVKPKS